MKDELFLFLNTAAIFVVALCSWLAATTKFRRDDTDRKTLKLLFGRLHLFFLTSGFITALVSACLVHYQGYRRALKEKDQLERSAEQAKKIAEANVALTAQNRALDKQKRSLEEQIAILQDLELKADASMAVTLSASNRLSSAVDSLHADNDRLSESIWSVTNKLLTAATHLREGQLDLAKLARSVTQTDAARAVEFAKLQKKYHEARELLIEALSLMASVLEGTPQNTQSVETTEHPGHAIGTGPDSGQPEKSADDVDERKKRALALVERVENSFRNDLGLQRPLLDKASFEDLLAHKQLAAFEDTWKVYQLVGSNLYSIVEIRRLLGGLRPPPDVREFRGQ
jgi:uncharacterized coiled-coil protein SlyX